MRTNKRQTIFFPFICQDIQDDPKPPKKNAKYIIKSVNFDSNNEIEISKKIQTILNYSNYFNPIEKDSYINIEELDEEVLTQILKKQPNTDKIYHLFTLKDVSNTSFYQYFYNIHNQKNPKKYVYNMIEYYKSLLQILQITTGERLVYLNINPTNILINTDNQPVLTNFNSSFYFPITTEERKSNLFSKYDPANYFLPLEVQVICFMNKYEYSSLSVLNIETICDNWINFSLGAGSLSIFSKELIERFKEVANFSLQKFINKPKRWITDELLNSYATWDNYSLSMMYLVLLKNVFKEVFNKKKNKFITDFSQILIENIHPVSLKRHSIEHTVELFDDIINNMKQLDIMEAIDSF